MSHPLDLAYNWRTPILVSTVGLFACATLLVSQRAAGWVAVLAVLVVCWLVLLAVVWSRTRAYLEVDGAWATVRRFRTKHRVAGTDVAAVRRLRTLTGPGYRLTLADGTRRTVTTSLLRDGGPTLLRWLVRYAPQATRDPATEAAIDRLRSQGLLDSGHA
ncbi:hypothetical protein [Microlunatus parietis]|uniref:PH domain-containing protein n=1 Tax=Microlunatus parietis TaxID=682979 RepID=A0A7Y9I8L1_9ACTN|nr:hypothetical protein [Microlunatus parietis]NYE72192.1 hypothetical protein [Microlunatus parietis]